MIKEALFSDGTKEYRIPAEPDKNEKVLLRFRTAAGDTDGVFLCDKDGEYPMEKAERTGKFDFYQKEVRLGESKYTYHFRVVSGETECLYGREGVCSKEEGCTDFAIVPGFSVPEWSKGAVMYQIMVDRFCNGDPSNDVLDREYYYSGLHAFKSHIWEKCPDEKSFGEFYGGDLEGVRQKLDYLKELGVEVIYFNPLFVSPSSHKYDTEDYNHIDPHFGKILVDEGEVLDKDCKDNTKASRYISRVTDQKNLEASDRLFQELVKEIHARGMRVILDGVFNHCGSFNKWLDKEKIYSEEKGYAPGAFADKDSPYRDYFYFKDKEAWPDNNSYEGWWDYDTLPKLNYDESGKLYQEILAVGAKWVSAPYNADGWRLDVAADLGQNAEINHRFWHDFRDTVKKANPDAVILAEHYGDPEDWLQGDEWDTVMNYDAFMEPVTWFLTGMEKHSEEYDPKKIGDFDYFDKSMKKCMAKFMTPSLQCAMNELSNHDHSRFLTRTNHKAGKASELGTAAASEGIDKGVFRQAVVMQMTWPGAPTVYYGDEAGVCGFTDPDNRRTYPWGHEDRELLDFHKDIIRIHKENPVLRDGSLKMLHGEQNVICYGRFNEEDQMITAVNNGDTAKQVDLDVWTIGVPEECEMEQLLYTNGATGYSTHAVTYAVREGKLDISLPKHSALILRKKS